MTKSSCACDSGRGFVSSFFFKISVGESDVLGREGPGREKSKNMKGEPKTDYYFQNEEKATTRMQWILGCVSQTRMRCFSETKSFFAVL